MVFNYSFFVFSPTYSQYFEIVVKKSIFKKSYNCYYLSQNFDSNSEF